MEELIEKIAKAPLPAKIGILVGTITSLAILNYFVIGIPLFGDSISDVEAKIVKVEKEQKTKDLEYIEKQAIANNLNQYRREKELLEQRLAEALAELPNEKNIDELLQQLHDRAIKAGLDISSIEPQAAASEGFYARIPIPIQVTGNFHEIATFFDSLGRLTRIVNINNIAMDQPKDVNGKVIVNAKFLATTFMFVQQQKPAAKPAGG
jgi:type IV pilus assembly protein PilO